MSNFKLLENEIGVKALRKQIEAHPELWDTQNMRRLHPQSPHKDGHDIWVRYNDITFFEPKDPEKFSDPHIPIWYPAWNVLTELQPLVRYVAGVAESDMIGGILITRIPAGCKIPPHRDTGWHVNYFDKFYLTIQNGPGGKFSCDAGSGCSETIEPKAGDLYRFDNRILHWVDNDSTVDRITAIICLRTHLFRKPGDWNGM